MGLAVVLAAAYAVIDLTAGTNRPCVSYLETVPAGGWSREYKTEKLVLRHVDPGSFVGEGETFTLTRPFWCGIFEVTQKQYELVTGRRFPCRFDGDDKPVDSISHDQIRGSRKGAGWPTSGDVDEETFLGCLRRKTGLAFDLPTEVQWEYVCRAGGRGQDPDNTAPDAFLMTVGRFRNTGAFRNPDDNSTIVGTATVGTYAPNAWGIYDLFGNVWEWTLDRADGGEGNPNWNWWINYTWKVEPKESHVDPVGRSDGSARICRGGGWWGRTGTCRTGGRGRFNPSKANGDHGFRVVVPDGDGFSSRTFGTACPDLFVGTLDRGNTTPAATYPFGLIQPGPDTTKKPDVLNLDVFHASGYQHSDQYIWRFSQLHFSGTGGPGLGNIGIMPFGGEWAGFPAFPLVKASERAEPGYYSVDVENGLGRTTCEMTAQKRTAIYRFRWTDRTTSARLLLDLDWLLGHTEDPELWGFGHVVYGCALTRDGTGKDGIVSGWQYSKQWTQHTVYFAFRPSRTVKSAVRIRERTGITGETYVLDFGVIPDGELVLELGISNHSETGAERNLVAELGDKSFADVRRECAAAWARTLDWYELDPATSPEVRGNFDAAAYHLVFQPNLISDVGEKDDYSTFSLWDTFRAAHPLYALVYPELNAQFVLSMLDQYDRQGYLPIWAISGGENHCMIGHHAVPVVVDACLQGHLPSEQVERAYKAVKNSLTVQHCAVGTGCWGLTKEDWNVYDRCGYYPFDKLGGYDALSGRKVIGESAARTFECAYDDACAARLAEKLEHVEDSAFFRKRAGFWKNVFDTSLGLARGRDSKGNWRTPFDKYANGEGPFADNDFCEGGTMQYTWHVLHDPVGLAEALGGRKAMGERLDALFRGRQPKDGDAGFGYAQTGCLGMCVHGNEISHHIPYLYAFTDRPRNMGPILKKICEINYRPKPDGLCGNDDCGQMSAWYLFTALGFYPLDPCGGDFVLGAPQLPGARIRLGNGRTLEIEARNFGPTHPYVKSVAFNGRPVADGILRHADLTKGGRLVFEME